MNNNLTECMEVCRQQCLDLYPKTQLYKNLELGLVFLVVLLIAVSLFVGWKKLNEKNKKRYLKLEKVLDDEYMLQRGDDVYYLKKSELK
ncbi:hypothetical protein COY26_03330 [Candidatus Woesearchaeota archaeon CG_4_10_14_0_2_um_filter_33_10]|nr:MAG: hypothetical protein COY26_03330 [Candidatus Woesearchaeota archaeon CG_4_10_14_0_2_um_filter_33_10]